jgi:ribonuclease H / adenosylcobalamin/alpha-ribazole phosphatase
VIIYTTRHGQPATGTLPPGVDHEYPPGDPSLTELGRQQAACLGERLAADGFKGLIFSSPYRRTLETADIIASITNCTVIPEPTIQEYVLVNGTPAFNGLSLPEILERYPSVRQDSSLQHPWFVRGPETTDDVEERIKPFLASVLGLKTEEVLCVGHGASVEGCLALLAPEFRAKMDESPETCNWNCSLTTINARGLNNASLVQLFDISHMPRDMVTSNVTRLLDQ